MPEPPSDSPDRLLIVISIDGLPPAYVLKADEHGLKIPHLRRLLQDGAHAASVQGVLPTVTYPSHTTMLTGVWPDKHGIHSNETFDPYARTSVVSRFPTAALPALNVFTGASEWTHVLARGGSRKFQDHA